MFEVGDLVRVKDNAYEIGHSYIDFPSDMNQYCGHEYKVLKAQKRASGLTVYKLENVTADNNAMNGDGYWIFVEEWLEKVNETNIEIDDKELEEMFNWKGE